jgi:hypothetical protein
VPVPIASRVTFTPELPSGTQSVADRFAAWSCGVDATTPAANVVFRKWRLFITSDSPPLDPKLTHDRGVLKSKKGDLKAALSVSILPALLQEPEIHFDIRTDCNRLAVFQ